jgi:vacuolar-type H+-ATPase subunit H
MDKPLGQHIAELEKRMQQLSQEMMKNRKTRDERNRLESELRATQQALAYYQEAMMLEKRLQSQ